MKKIICFLILIIIVFSSSCVTNSKNSNNSIISSDKFSSESSLSNNYTSSSTKNSSQSLSIVDSSLKNSDTYISAQQTVSSSCSSTSSGLTDYTYPTFTNLTNYTDYSIYSTEERITQYNSKKWFYNELNIPLADPFVYEENGTYYIYGSTDRSICSTVDCYATKNFKNYIHYQNVYVPQQDSWEMCGENSALIFAPELFKYNGYYYLTYSNKAKKDNVRYLNIAKSSSPIGPFTPVKEQNSLGDMIDGFSAPVFNNNPKGIDVLDQHYLFDEDGQIYMYYSVYHNGDCEYIVGVKMIDILTADWSTYKILIKPGKLKPTDTESPLTWERYIDWFPVAEAPEIIKSPNGKYYLSYSVNHYPYRYYSVCYAYCDTPLGDFIKPYKEGEIWTNLLLGYGGETQGDVYEDWQGVTSGTAHHCFFKSGEEWMIGYHGHKNRGNDTATNWVARAFAVDCVYFDKEGIPFTVGPTYNLQFLPEKISGYKNIAPIASLDTRNVGNYSNLTDNYIVSNHNLLDRYIYKEAIIGSGYSYIILDFKKQYKIGGISIYNSSKYENCIYNVEYINLQNDNVIFNAKFPNAYYSDLKQFINPASAINIELNDVVTSKIIICFNQKNRAQLNEIKVYGKL